MLVNQGIHFTSTFLIQLTRPLLGEHLVVYFLNKQVIHGPHDTMHIYPFTNGRTPF